MLQNADTMVGFAVVMLLLSLIVMVLVQALVALFELRGKNLIASLAKLLMQIAPELRSSKQGSAIAREISTAVATHPSLVHFSNAQGKVGKLISRVFCRPGKAITSAEWIDILNDLAEDENANLSPGAQAFLKGIQKTSSFLAEPAFRGDLDLMARQFPAEAHLIEDAARRAENEAGRIVEGTERWFDNVMSRSSDWFTTQTRIWTVILSLAIAIAFRVDSLQILKQLSDNPEVRAKLAQRTDAVLNQTRLVPVTLTVESAQTELVQLKAQLDAAPLRIITSPFDSDAQSPTWFSLGAIITGLLLTLGAPFWFNALNQMASLSPSFTGGAKQGERSSLPAEKTLSSSQPEVQTKTA